MGSVHVLPSKVSVTTSDSQLSVMWVGRTAAIEIRQVTTLDNSGLFITTSVSLRNIDSVAVTNLYCKYGQLLLT